MRHRLVVTASIAVMVASLSVAGAPQNVDSPAFPVLEVASVKPNKSGDGRISLFFNRAAAS